MKVKFQVSEKDYPLLCLVDSIFNLSKIIKDDRQDSLLVGFNITNDGKGNPIIEVLDN